jgi:hypothetical protein
MEVKMVKTSYGEKTDEVEMVLSGHSFRMNALQLEELSHLVAAAKKMLLEAKREAFLKKNLSLFPN